MINLNIRMIICVALAIGAIYFFFFYNRGLKTKETMENNNNSDNNGDQKKSISAKIINYYSTDCGHCNRFKPEWNKFEASHDIKNMGIEAVGIQCNDPKNADVCDKADIEGYPSVIMYANGKKVLYNGQRTKEALTEFCKEFVN